MLLRMEFTLSDLSRRVENLLRVGSIAHVELAQKPRVRVQIGDILTAWIPAATLRAGASKTWNPPTVGEQVLVVSPSGDLASAFAVLAINSNHYPAPCTEANITRDVFPDGAQIDYDHTEHHYSITLPNDGKFTFKVGATILTMSSDETKIQTGQSNITLTDALAKVNIGATTLELTSSGTKLSTPSFDGVQS